MNSEQKQQRIERIREQHAWRQQHAKRFRINTLIAANDDIDFLLSIVKSQEAPSTSAHEVAIEWTQSTKDGSIISVEDIHRLAGIIDSAATSMRSACVEIAEKFRQRIQYESDEGMREAMFGDMVIEMESISLEDQK